MTRLGIGEEGRPRPYLVAFSGRQAGLLIVQKSQLQDIYSCGDKNADIESGIN